MKKSIYAGAAVFLLLLVGGCNNTTGPDSGHLADLSGKAAVSIEIEGAGIQGRSVLPNAALGDVTTWQLSGGKTSDPGTLFNEFSSHTGQTLYLEPGIWNFTLEGHKNISLILRGNITNKTISLEGPNTLSFAVTPILDGDGTVKITINLPPGHGITKAEVFREGVDFNTPLTPSGNSIVFEVPHAAGDYYFSFQLYKGAELYGVISELIKVRMNLPSEKIFTLEPENLNISYVINYHLNNGQLGGGAPNPDYYRRTDAAITLPTPTRTGYAFEGWYNDDEFGGAPVATIPTLSMEDKDFYAQWAGNTYTVEYDKNAADAEGSTLSSNHTYGTAKALTLNGFNRTGYDFDGWSANDDGGGTSYTNGQNVSNLSATQGDTVSLYAKWAATSYNITYHNLYDGTNDPANPDTYTIKSEAITLAAPSRAGYNFSGWFSDGSLSEGATGIPTGSIGDKDFYADWTGITYTVEYHKNAVDAGGDTLSSNHTYGTEAPLTANGFSRTGYDFDGWSANDDGSGTNYTNGESVSNLSDTQGATVPLYAKWAATSYNIIYHNLYDGTNAPANPNTYTIKSEAITLANPSRTGYNFSGWFSDAGLSESATGIPAGSTGNKDFYADWTGKTYTVAYYKNAVDAGGSTGSSNHTYGTEAPLTANGFSRTGYIFDGWNTQSGGGGKNYIDEESVVNLSAAQGDTVPLFAKWKGITYTVTYNPNGGSGTTSPSPHTYGTEKTLTPNGFGRTGFIFVEWNTDPNGGGTSYTDGQSVINLSDTQSATVPLYAQWIHDVPVNVSLWVDQDGSILISNNDVTISKSGGVTYFNATVTGAYTGVQWYLYGNPVYGSRGKAQSIRINAADFVIGKYYLGVTVTKDGKPYSTDIHFTVTN
jgi:uncharacterized repeat protein (TIGR02543 family)